MDVNNLDASALAELDPKALTKEDLQAVATHASKAMNYHSQRSNEYRDQWRRFVGEQNNRQLLPFKLWRPEGDKA